MVTGQKYQRHPLCRFAVLPPKGAARGLYEFALVQSAMVFCVPPETPPARDARHLSFALSSCTPFYKWLHLLNLSGEVGLGSPMGELAARKG